MPEYLSVGFYRTSLPNGAGESLTVLINGKVADLKQYRVNQGQHPDADFPSWGKLKKIEVLSNKTDIDDEVLIKLFWKGNTDVAVLANHYAKDGWSLFKVRDNRQYLLFQR